MMNMKYCRTENVIAALREWEDDPGTDEHLHHELYKLCSRIKDRDHEDNDEDGNGTHRDQGIPAPSGGDPEQHGDQPVQRGRTDVDAAGGRTTRKPDDPLRSCAEQRIMREE